MGGKRGLSRVTRKKKARKRSDAARKNNSFFYCHLISLFKLSSQFVSITG